MYICYGYGLRRGNELLILLESRVRVCPFENQTEQSTKIHWKWQSCSWRRAFAQYAQNVGRTTLQKSIKPIMNMELGVQMYILF